MKQDEIFNNILFKRSMNLFKYSRRDDQNLELIIDFNDKLEIVKIHKK